MKNIAVFASGGDAPGMNACIRAVVRGGIFNKLNVFGIHRGYTGLLNEEFEQLNARSVSNIIQKGGTILKTSRSKEFTTEEGLIKAAGILNRFKIDGILGIGGNGTFKGLISLSDYWKGQIIGLPGTIDNDLYGTDFTIGFDTAVNTAMEAIDKIRDTADSHDRYFIIEVMGRDAGFIGLNTAISGGAEQAILPEVCQKAEDIANELHAFRKAGKTSSIIIASEGTCLGSAATISKKLQELTGDAFNVSNLGYIQRGGSPTANDRILASRLGVYAVQLFLEGKTGVMSGEIKGELCATPLKDAVEKKKDLDLKTLELIKILSI